ncbi:MAG TPA: DNA-processing protein DprA, partial [Burkholderiales bacterium]|nr:DNA-processing protein DprA [Burkholderiales bacterium]
MALVPGVGAASFRKLLLRFGSPQAACEANLSQLASCVGETAAQAIRAGPDSKSLSRSLQWLTKPGNELVTLADPRYPPSLLEIGDPPPLIYVSGRTELLLNSSLAIVGARAPTARGVEDAERFAETLSNCGLTIVSGLALGIDAAAHRGGLRGIASSVAVLGTGL